MKTKFALAIIILMIASCISASGTTTKFIMENYTFKFNSSVPCTDIYPVEDNEKGKDMYFASAFNHTVYFMLIHDSDLDLDPMFDFDKPSLDLYLSKGVTTELLNFGAINDTISIYSGTIEGKPAMVGTGFIPTEKSTHNYQYKYGNSSLDTGYTTASNSTEYQLRFYIAPEFIGVVGSGDEALFRSVLRSINVTQKAPKKPECEEIAFDIKICDLYWKQCNNGKYDAHFKLAGLTIADAQGPLVSIDEIERCPSCIHKLACGKFGLGKFEQFEYCFYQKGIASQKGTVVYMASSVDSIFHKKQYLKNLTIQK